MKITIMSLKQAIKYQPPINETCSIIRVLEPNVSNESLQHTDQFKEVLELQFHDLEESPYLPSNTRLFNKQDAELLVSFFERNRNIDSIIVHCHAGVSRSPAIALGLSWYLRNQQLEQAVMDSGKYVPNPLVMRILAETIGVYDEKQEFINNYLSDINFGIHEIEW